MDDFRAFRIERRIKKERVFLKIYLNVSVDRELGFYRMRSDFSSIESIAGPIRVCALHTTLTIFNTNMRKHVDVRRSMYFHKSAPSFTKIRDKAEIIIAFDASAIIFRTG